MRTRTVLGAAVLGMLVTGPVATAAEAPSIAVRDKQIQAGQAVGVVAGCDATNFTGSKVTSPALDADDLGSADPGEPAYTSAKVKPGTKPGHYTLSFTCGGKTVTGAFDVAAGNPGAAADGDDLPDAAQAPEEDDTVTAAPAQPSGPNYGLIALAGGGVLVAGGVGFLVFRRARRRA
ncbi:hypothetical protein [Actinocrispum wychmicini]|uniref:LPXTG-motif cell wall-anchored protein n=1 Tax=Actinocrispum wychmicini TaxID=1213861 RepID=A0A4R2JLT5_9PSEU|nr:hypothetical protein [Actinocrispum wychmicini]TCO58028.1 hypothetical protein EV192_10590 [Actinocrispum wychmicini]